MKEILCSELSANNRLVIIYKENGKIYRSIRMTHIGEIELKEIKELGTDVFSEVAQENLLKREKYRKENLIKDFENLPLLECNERDNIYGDGITLTSIGIKEDSIKYIVLKKMVKKMYVYDGYIQYPHIIEKLLAFIFGEIKHHGKGKGYFGEVVTSPNQIELENYEIKNLKDGAIDLDFVQHISKGVGLKESTLLGLINSYKGKEEQKKFKTKVRKRRR